MATRSNIVVRFGASIVYLYRHWDGYLAENGATIAACLKATTIRGNSAGPAFLEMLLDQKDDKGRQQYEFTTEYHGDIERVYDLLFVAGDIIIRYNERPASYPDVDKWADKGETYHLPQFIALVNQERAECNARLAHKRKESPEFYGKIADYPLLDAP